MVLLEGALRRPVELNLERERQKEPGAVGVRNEHIWRFGRARKRHIIMVQHEVCKMRTITSQRVFVKIELIHAKRLAQC